MEKPQGQDSYSLYKQLRDQMKMNKKELKKKRVRVDNITN